MMMNESKPAAKIIGIQFSMLSPDEIRKNSVLEITSKDTYVNNQPVPGGLFDSRMGVLEPKQICPTDGMYYIDTPGYFGHIELARPVFFIQHLKEITKICRTICFKCSKLKISKLQHKHVLDMRAEDRWQYVFERASKVKRCGDQSEDGCGCKQPDKIKQEGMAGLFAIWDDIASDNSKEKQKVVIKLTPEIVLKLFKRISDEDVYFMGFSPVWSRPDWMVCTVLPIAPPAVRPSVKHDAQQRSEDDLTHIYNNIIKINNTLKEKLAAGAQTHASTIEMSSEMLQHAIAMIVNNKIKGVAPMAQRSGRPFQCIMDRINSKNGRIRGNLMGKRVDFSARSVITGDPNLSIRQLGVPLKVAMNITKPVVVNERNRAFLTKLVVQGADVWPGAKILERKDTKISISLRNRNDRESLVLANGDIVHRHMMDGDVVLFNRQPSLHRMSMMAHIVKVMPVGDTFRMNVGDTKPYNADFDGDEMNMHMPQNILAETELRYLAAIPYQQITPTSNQPIIGIFQDSLLGSYLLTRPHVSFTRREAMALLSKIDVLDFDALEACGDRITSFQLLSQIFPKMTVKFKTGLFREDRDTDEKTTNNILEIYNGEYRRGQLEKKALGSTSRILHRIFNDFGPMACADFNDHLQSIVTEYMKQASFSVGMSDLIADRKTEAAILKIIAEKKAKAQAVMDRVHLGIFENTTAHSNKTEFENQVNNIMNEAVNDAGKEGKKNLDPNNRFKMIVESGSKGSELNIAQMISCLGQQNVDGKRIPYGFNNRTLPHYTKYDDSPNARGFVENSYISGLTPPELFFHAMGGRIGLIDTAVKTASIGYVQRRIIKALEDLKVEYDMTVRNSKGKIIQYAYGDDGFDTTKVENQVIPLVNHTIEEIYKHYDMSDDSVYNPEAKKKLKHQAEELKKRCLAVIETMIRARDDLVVRVFKYKRENTVVLPVNVHALTLTIQGQLDLGNHCAVDVTPLEAFQLIDEYLDRWRAIPCVRINPLFETLLQYYLSPRELLVKRRFHRAALILLLETLTLKFKEAIVHPGEMVGVVSGQSLSEPLTQLTLNSIIWSEKIVVKNKNGCIISTPIGAFIEQQIQKSKKVDYMEAADTTYAELSPDEEYYEVPCLTEDGENVWRRIEAVTQHPVVNEDGTNTMLKITTKGNRVVTATKAKSFLKLVDGKIQGVNGSDLQVGDYLPVSRKPLAYKETHILNLRSILPPSEYLYGTELAKANAVRGEGHWWKNHANKTFVLPHTSSQSLSGLFRETPQKGKTPNKYLEISSGCVYMKSMGCCKYVIPENLELNYEFGYLLGAYAAEGSANKHHVSICNNCNEYLKPIENLCVRWNIITNKSQRLNRGGEEWKSQELDIYNSIIARTLIHLCGTLSYAKTISPTIVFSNRQCILGFLDAYIGGDGSVTTTVKNSKDNSKIKVINAIKMYSTSHALLMDVMMMLRNIGISSSIYEKNSKNIPGRTIQHRHTSYTLDVKNGQAIKLAGMLNLTIPEKQRRILQLRTRTCRYEYSVEDKYFYNYVTAHNAVVKEPRDDRMMDVYFDEIIRIEEVPNPTPYAYDLTVEDTRNFDLYNGLAMRDTFHSSGNGSKSNITRGVPRIEEILRLTKNPKSPSMTVFLHDIEEADQDKAAMLATELEHTKLIDVVKVVQICFDPNEQSSNLIQDRVLLEQFYAFENMVQECAGRPPGGGGLDEAAAGPKVSKWIVRMEFDGDKLLDKNLTMDDIHFAITRSPYAKDVYCVFSDYNMDNLVFRIRINATVFTKNKKRAPEPLDQSDEIYLLKHFQDTLLNNIVLRGVHGIRNVQPRELLNTVKKEDGQYVGRKCWVLDTTGSNLLHTLGLDTIDYTRTYTNDIRETFDVLGIEAARQVILNEFYEVMEMSGTYINYHHMNMLADRMTCNKDMVSIFRTGLLNDDVGPIAKATFEVHTEVLLNATRHAEFDHMRGVSANIMCGQHGSYGTSTFDLVLDMKALGDQACAAVQEPGASVEDLLKTDTGADTCSRQVMEIKNNVEPQIQQSRAVVLDKLEANYDLGF